MGTKGEGALGGGGEVGPAELAVKGNAFFEEGGVVRGVLEARIEGLEGEAEEVGGAVEGDGEKGGVFGRFGFPGRDGGVGGPGIVEAAGGAEDVGAEAFDFGEEVAGFVELFLFPLAGVAGGDVAGGGGGRCAEEAAHGVGLGGDVGGVEEGEHGVNLSEVGCGDGRGGGGGLGRG